MAKRIDEIFDEIKGLSDTEKREFLRLLPKAIDINPEDLLWARLAESAFGFWDNPEDAIYDEL